MRGRDSYLCERYLRRLQPEFDTYDLRHEQYTPVLQRDWPVGRQVDRTVLRPDPDLFEWSVRLQSEPNAGDVRLEQYASILQRRQPVARSGRRSLLRGNTDLSQWRMRLTARIRRRPRVARGILRNSATRAISGRIGLPFRARDRHQPVWMVRAWPAAVPSSSR